MKLRTKINAAGTVKWALQPSESSGHDRHWPVSIARNASTMWCERTSTNLKSWAISLTAWHTKVLNYLRGIQIYLCDLAPRACALLYPPRSRRTTCGPGAQQDAPISCVQVSSLIHRRKFGWTISIIKKPALIAFKKRLQLHDGRIISTGQVVNSNATCFTNAPTLRQV